MAERVSELELLIVNVLELLIVDVLVVDEEELVIDKVMVSDERASKPLRTGQRNVRVLDTTADFELP